MTTQPTTSDMTVKQLLEDLWNDGMLEAKSSSYPDSQEKIQEALAAIEAHYAAKHKEANDLANKYARIIAAVYDGERVEDAEPRIMAERLNNTEEQV